MMRNIDGPDNEMPMTLELAPVASAMNDGTPAAMNVVGGGVVVDNRAAVH